MLHKDGVSSPTPPPLVNMPFLKTIIVCNCIFLLICCISFTSRPAVNPLKIRTFVISATYSRFQDTINLVIITKRELRHVFHCRTTNGLIGNESVSSHPRIFAYDRPFFACSWFPNVAECASVSSPTNLTLTSFAGEVLASGVPIRYAETVQREVVVCMTPLFLYERWRQLIATIEIYQHYRAERISIYVIHALNAAYRLLKAYEASGVVSLSLWPTLPKIGDINPNHQIEFGNQVAAFDDCFHLYKESARFIIFADIDDILVPRLGQSYAEEFQLLTERWPLASTFMYNRIFTHLYRTEDKISLGEFRLNKTLSAIKTLSCFRTRFRKRVVVGDRVKNIHIHWSGTRSSPIYRDEEIPCNENAFLHFRSWLFSSEVQTRPSQLGISELHLDKLQENYERLIRQHELVAFLPQEEVFMADMEKCYAEYTWRSFSLQCSGPYLCAKYLHQQNISCFVTKSQFDMPLWRSDVFGVLRDTHIVEQSGCGEL